MIRSLAALLGTISLATLALAASPSPALKATVSPKASASASSSPVPTLAPVIIPSGGTQATVGVWTVHTASTDVDWHTGDFSVPNHLLMVRTGGDINADRASGNYKKKVTTLYGHVVMHDDNGFSSLSSAKAQAPSSRGPSTLSADQVALDDNGKIYTATGNVHYVQADTTVDADTGKLNDTTHDLDLSGNVHITQGTRNMSASHVLYNTISGKAHAEGDVVMQFPSQVSPHFATPRPIHVRNILQKPKPQPT